MNLPLILHQVNRETWLKLTLGFADYNYRQSWDFGIASAVRVGASSEHVAVECLETKTVVGLADVRVRTLPFINTGVAYINGGPLVRISNKADHDTLLTMVNLLIEEYVVRRKLVLRIAPAVMAEKEENRLVNVLASKGFLSKVINKKTIILDISQDQEEIRKNLHQKWRNCLNKSERSDLKLSEGRNTILFERFVPLFNDLINNKKFLVDLDINFYLDVQKCAAEQDKFIVILAEHKGEPVAGYVASILGDTCVYLLGAANDIGRNMNAAYLLQWAAIQKAKALGCQWYDLGGIDPEGNPGVYNFKKRMGGKEIILPGPFQITPGGWNTMVCTFGEKVFTFLKQYLVK